MTEPPRSGPQAHVVDRADQPGSSDHPQPSPRAPFWAHLRTQLDLILDQIVHARYVGRKSGKLGVRCYSEICGICGCATAVFVPDPRNAPHYPGCPVTLLRIGLAEIEAADANAQTCLTVPFSALRPVPETGQGSDYAEPWRLPLDAYETVVDRFGETVVDMLGGDMPKRFEADYARRIAACVNFCWQVPTDVLEVIGGARFPVGFSAAGNKVTAINDFSDGEPNPDGGAA